MEPNNETYDVGRVIYFINPKDESVIPALITEVIIRRRLNAQTTASYVTNIITKSGSRNIELNPVETMLFASLGEVRLFMIEKTTKKIDQIISIAERVAEKLNPGQADNDNPDSVQLVGSGTDADAHVVTLPDGSTARLKV